MQPAFNDYIQMSQQVFRLVLQATSRPATLVKLPQELCIETSVSPASTALLLTLADQDTPVWLDPASNSMADYLRFHCGCPITTTPTEAHFALVGAPGNLDSLNQFNPGTDEHPEKSTSLIIEVDSIQSGRGKKLHGPGINGEAQVYIEGLSDSFWLAVADQPKSFPRGIDLFFCCGDQLLSIPRTTCLEN